MTQIECATTVGGYRPVERRQFGNIVGAEVSQRTVRGAMAHTTQIIAHPDTTVASRHQMRNAIVQQTVLLAPHIEAILTRMIVAETIALSRYKETVARRIGQYRVQFIAAQAAPMLFEHREPESVVTGQTALSTHPDITLTILSKALHMAVWQTVGNTQVHIVLSLHNRKLEGEACQHKPSQYGLHPP